MTRKTWKSLLNHASVTRRLAQIRAAASEFYQDESGLNIIEIILIIFVAVIILIALAAFFNDTIYSKVKDTINTLLGTNIS